MSKYNLIFYGSDLLRQKSRDITRVDDDILELVDNMARIMYESRGIGLAGPQVGVPLNLFLADMGDELNIFLNPKILETGPKKDSFEEGCLSLPEITVLIERPTSLLVEYMDLEEKLHREEIDGFLSRIIQHESDHLQGRLIVDYLGAMDRELLKKKLRTITTKNNHKLI